MNALVLGIGNVLLHDEGFGVRVVEELERSFSFPEGVELMDGGTCGMDLRDRLCHRDLLVIVDAMKNGSPPGTAYRLIDEEIPAYFHTRISPHQLGISDLLASLALTGSLPPRLVLFGMEPEDLTTGLGLSPLVEAGMAKVVAAVGEELASLGLQPQPLAPESRPVGFWASRHLPPSGE